MMSTESIKKALKSLNCYDKWDVKEIEHGYSVYFDGGWVLNCYNCSTVHDVVKDVMKAIRQQIKNEQECIPKLEEEFGVKVKYEHFVEKRYGLYKS